MIEERVVSGCDGGRNVGQRGERRTGAGANAIHRIDGVDRCRANVAGRCVRIRPIVLADAVVTGRIAMKAIRVSGICIRVCHFHLWTTS